MNAPAHPTLTGKLAEIAEAGGVRAALQLAREMGGRELKLSARPGGKLARIVGPEAARKIVDAMGAEKIVIPMAHLRGQAGRRAAVARMLDSGATVSQAATAADVHERTVFRVKGQGRRPDADPTGDLFDPDNCQGLNPRRFPPSCDD